MSEKNERNIGERVDMFIATHQATYSDAITSAREAAETTATAAWQQRFGDCIKAHRELVKEQVKYIKNALEILKDGDASEDDEKAIRDATKAIGEERTRHAAWWSRAVQPFRNAAERCNELARAAVRAADEAERSATLIDRGLAAGVRERVATWPTARWDDERGAVIVEEAKGNDAREEAA